MSQETTTSASLVKDPKTPVEKAMCEKEVPEVEYTQEEMEYRNFLLNRIYKAKCERDSPHIEFDNMTYLQWYNSNQKADLSYIPPKKNPQD